MERLLKLASKSSRLVVGLNSGTSMDGIDALLVSISGAGMNLRVQSKGFLTVPFRDSVRERLLKAPHLTAFEVTQLDREMGECFADAVFEVCKLAEIDAGEVDLVGSHGQTICHLPGKAPVRPAASLQIGDLDIIAERTGCVVVGDFRARDIAAGGEGAPLMPWLDWLQWREKPRTLSLNLGGIANLTLVMEEPENCRAFDVGPANLPLDLMASRLTNGAESYDPGGRMAAEGHSDPILLERLMAHPFLLRSPPKTTGREEFGADFVDDLLGRNQHLALKDILATTCTWVAKSIHLAAEEWLSVPGGHRELVVSGGGVRNLTLMRHLKSAFFPVPVTPCSNYGLDPDAKEALLFALLANERLAGGPANMPAATGARWPVRLGKITF